jgi:hypothetical protein
MTDEMKIAVLRASMSNIGRLLPAGMTVSFSRPADGSACRLEQIYPNGETLTADFLGHSPIYTVPVVPAEYGVAS